MLQVDTAVKDNTARIILKGRFDFSSHREFRKAMEEMMQVEGIREIETDLGDVEYLDSAALGILLLLRDRCLEKNLGVALANSQGVVADILRIANFQKLFAIR